MTEDHYLDDWTDEPTLYPAHSPDPWEFRGTMAATAAEVAGGLLLWVVAAYGGVFLAAVLQGVVG